MTPLAKLFASRRKQRNSGFAKAPAITMRLGEPHDAHAALRERFDGKGMDRICFIAHLRRSGRRQESWMGRKRQNGQGVALTSSLSLSGNLLAPSNHGARFASLLPQICRGPPVNQLQPFQPLPPVQQQRV
jgi:hypothetical protein